MKDIAFTNKINKLYHLIYTEWGSEHPALEIIQDFFPDDKNDIITDKKVELAWKYNEDGMFTLLRTLMNWDFFWVKDDGKIDVKNANDPKVAKIMSTLVSPQMALKVRSYLG